MNPCWVQLFVLDWSYWFKINNLIRNNKSKTLMPKKWYLGTTSFSWIHVSRIHVSRPPRGNFKIPLSLSTWTHGFGFGALVEISVVWKHASGKMTWTQYLVEKKMFWPKTWTEKDLAQRWIKYWYWTWFRSKWEFQIESWI